MIRGARKIETLCQRCGNRLFNSVRRHVSSSTTKSSNKSAKKDERDLKWTERKEAPKWMQKMAPTKGGIAPPNRLEMSAILLVGAVGGYAWFVDEGSFFVKMRKAND